jgi:hypothetical protein
MLSANMLLTLLNAFCNIPFADAELFASDTNTSAHQIHQSPTLSATGFRWVLLACASYTAIHQSPAVVCLQLHSRMLLAEIIFTDVWISNKSIR